jgi:transcriptional regulator with XRE-family HTH domain
MDRVTGPLGPRRSIASALKEQRQKSGKLLNEVAADLMISTSKLSRLENGQGKPQPRDIRDLIAYYKLEKTPLAGQLEHWVQDAQRTGWWTGLDDDVVIDGLDAHLADETYATVARIYTLPFVPALLQTDNYARALLHEVQGYTEAETEQLLQARRRRREVLSHREGLKPLQLIAVTHEMTLHQQVGSPVIMAEQLDELMKRSAAPNVRLRVLPFTAAPNFSMTCMYAHFEYKDGGASDIVHVETHAGFFSVDDHQQVKEYRAAHGALVRASLSEQASADLIAAARDSLGPKLPSPNLQ